MFLLFIPYYLCEQRQFASVYLRRHKSAVGDAPYGRDRTHKQYKQNEPALLTNKKIRNKKSVSILDTSSFCLD